MASVAPVIVKVECVVRLWPSFWRHPIRHIRLKRFWKSAAVEELYMGPVAKRLRELEEDAFINGNGGSAIPDKRFGSDA